MESKFESELAGQVARRHKNPLRSRANVLLTAVVSCVVMIAAAAAVLSMQVSASLGEPTEYTNIFYGDDYLVNVDGVPTYSADVPVEDNFFVKRTSSLKWIEFDTPGYATVDYTKIVYSVNVNLRDISAFSDGVTGMVVADLDVAGFLLYSPWIASANVCINDVEVMSNGAIVLGELPYLAPSFDSATGTLSVAVTLPDISSLGLTYNSGDTVSIFVMFKTVEVGLTITGSEIGFPDFQVPTEL